MCGIVGIIGKHNPELIDNMSISMVHRGPDDGGVFSCEDISLGMRRLSIIDIDGGHQPMHTDDGRYVIIYNGEIYNADALRKELHEEGVRFKTDHSDTEVLLQLLVQKGEKGLHKLNGMFAFAFLDLKRKTILCARDRLGIKPFFYTIQSGRFAFASEIKSLLVLPWIERIPNINSLFHYFSLQYVPGESTAFKRIQRLAPGTLLSYDITSQNFSIKRWWSFSFPAEIHRSDENLIDTLANAISSAVVRWSVSDVPIGCLLSGGLDSSTIVSLLSQKGQHLKTYTVGFRGQGEEAWDELHLAKKIAEKWGTEHHQIILDPENLLDELIDMVWALDEPYGGGLPSWAVFKAMSSGVKVALTGTGGDELFGNYNKYVSMEGRFRGMIPGLRRRRIDQEHFKRKFFEKYYYASDREKRECMLTSDFNNSPDTNELLWGYFNNTGENEDIRDRVVRTDMATQLPEEFLMMTDRFSMAHSIEARTPLLDHELVQLVYSINAGIRLNPRTYKPLLRKAVKNILPTELLNAPKRGFVIPLKIWLRGRLRPLLKRLLNHERLKSQGLVQSDFYDRYARPHVEGKFDNTNKLWSMLMFQLWWDVYILQRPLDELRAEIKGVS